MQPSHALLETGDNTETEGVFSSLQMEHQFLISEAGSLADLTAAAQGRSGYDSRTRRQASVEAGPSSAIINDRCEEG